MSPQPTAAPVAAQPHKDLLDRIEKVAADDRTSAQKQIARALRLERERSEAMKKIAANREYLRLMEENEELDGDEADWLDDFYPQKERGQSRSDDEIERTRKAKAAARA
jgi:uncharacterized protein YegJ (DUF2314 family)